MLSYCIIFIFHLIFCLVRKRKRIVTKEYTYNMHFVRLISIPISLKIPVFSAGNNKAVVISKLNPFAVCQNTRLDSTEMESDKFKMFCQSMWLSSIFGYVDSYKIISLAFVMNQEVTQQHFLLLAIMVRICSLINIKKRIRILGGVVFVDSTGVMLCRAWYCTNFQCDSGSFCNIRAKQIILQVIPLYCSALVIPKE